MSANWCLVFSSMLYTLQVIFWENFKIQRLCPGICYEKEQKRDISSSLNVIKWVRMGVCGRAQGMQPFCAETFIPDVTSLGATRTLETCNVGEGFLRARRKKQPHCLIHKIILWCFFPSNPNTGRKDRRQLSSRTMNIYTVLQSLSPSIYVTLI